MKNKKLKIVIITGSILFIISSIILIVVQSDILNERYDYGDFTFSNIEKNICSGSWINIYDSTTYCFTRNDTVTFYNELEEKIIYDKWVAITKNGKTSIKNWEWNDSLNQYNSRSIQIFDGKKLKRRFEYYGKYVYYNRTIKSITVGQTRDKETKIENIWIINFNSMKRIPDEGYLAQKVFKNAEEMKSDEIQRIKNEHRYYEW